MIDTGKACEQCGKALVADARHASVKRFCNGHCRYEAWKERKEHQLAEMVRQLAGRVRL